MAKKTKYNYTDDWFSEWIPIWEKMLKPFVDKKNVAYLEVGVWEGRSLIWMLDNVLIHPTCRATAIDPLPKEQKGKFLDNLSLSGHKNKVTVIEGYSQKKLMDLSDQKFDIIYLDGSHKAKAILMDLLLAWELLKKNGTLIIDDYLWKSYEVPIDQSPKAAVDSFLTFYGDELELVYSSYQLFIKKTMDSNFEQDKSYLRNDSYFHWELGKLFRLKKDGIHSKSKGLSKEIPLNVVERDAIIKYLILKKFGQYKPDLQHINNDEKEILKKFIAFR
jgi:hypothetical protein